MPRSGLGEMLIEVIARVACRGLILKPMAQVARKPAPHLKNGGEAKAQACGIARRCMDNRISIAGALEPSICREPTRR